MKKIKERNTTSDGRSHATRQAKRFKVGQFIWFGKSGRMCIVEHVCPAGYTVSRCDSGKRLFANHAGLTACILLFFLSIACFPLALSASNGPEYPQIQISGVDANGNNLPQQDSRFLINTQDISSQQTGTALGIGVESRHAEELYQPLSDRELTSLNRSRDCVRPTQTFACPQSVKAPTLAVENQKLSPAEAYARLLEEDQAFSPPPNHI